MDRYKKQLIETQNIKFCPQDCEYLSINESEQNRHPDKPDHICLKFNVRVKHEIFHPELIRCEQCNLEKLNEKYRSMIKIHDGLCKKRYRLENRINDLEKEIDEFREGARSKGYGYDWDDENVMTWKKRN